MGLSAGFSDTPSPGRKLLSRIPWAARISACIAALVCGTLVLAVHLSLERRRQALAEERGKLAAVLLAQYVDIARVFLLNDDTLGLNLLLGEPPHLEGLMYVAVVDTRGIITAHSDPTKVGSHFATTGTRPNEPGARRPAVDLSLPADAASLVDLTKPVMVGAKELGSVHLGVSLRQLRTGVKGDLLSLLYPLLLFGALAALIATTVSICMRMRCERSVAPQSPASEDAARVNGRVSLPTAPADKLGALAKALRGAVGALRRRAFPGQGGERSPSRGNLDSVQIDGTRGEGGEVVRSQVAVLCAGIRGFRECAEAREPREVLQELNEYFSIAADNIVVHGGSIDKFLGDAVVAVFASSPLAPNHSERAIRSAVALQHALRGQGGGENQLLKRVGIGISSGVVISGQIGPDLTKNYGSIGESFKAAYSLHLMAHPGGIVMSKEVYRDVEHLVSVEPLPPRRKVERFRSWENFRLLDLVGTKGDDSTS
ncbi:MAG TPA: adenylate/guanylate cyclase domain-containing protein [Syntrophobacteria bacterium]|nr:adenylate/guanylate cyclase domain-containing protein [Syntrophobacteria bacterium]